MKLDDLLSVIDSNLEFVLYSDIRIGVFKINDKGLKPYLQCDVTNINIYDNRMCIYLD